MENEPMTISLETIVDDFASRSLNIKLEAVEFWYHDILLAKAPGRLYLNSSGKLQMSFENRVAFTRSQDFNVIEVDEHIQIGARLDQNMFFRGRLANFSSFDFFCDTGGQPPLTFQRTIFAPDDFSETLVQVDGYITEFPIQLTCNSDANPKVFEFKAPEFLMRGENRGANYHISFRAQQDVLTELGVGAAIYSIGVMHGKQCSWRTKLDVNARGQKRLTLYSAEIRTTNFYAPFVINSFNTEWNEEIFLQVHKFLVNNPDSAVVRMFGMLWASSGTDFDARAVLLGIATEGLAKSIKIKTKQATEFEGYKSRMIAALETFESGEKQIDGISSNDISRVIGIIKGTSNYTAKELIENAAKKVGFTITKEQLDAWGKVRNKRGHGTFGFFPTEDDWTTYMICVDVFNHFCLAMMGFTDSKYRKRWFHPSSTPAVQKGSAEKKQV